MIDNLVYLARPIDKTGQNSGLVYSACMHIQKILTTCNPNFFMFDPGGGCYALNDFSSDSGRPINGIAKILRDTNEAIIKMSNLVVALYLHRVPTVGVVTEIDFCRRENVPLVIITDEQPGMYLMGMIHHPEQIVVCTELSDEFDVESIDHPDTYRFVATAIEASLTFGPERTNE